MQNASEFEQIGKTSKKNMPLHCEVNPNQAVGGAARLIPDVHNRAGVDGAGVSPSAPSAPLLPGFFPCRRLWMRQ
jgi:hypothetical protein